MNRIIACFLWGGNANHHRYHLCNLQALCRPKDHDGWSIINLRIFNKALLVKSLWRAINGAGNWSIVIKSKYLSGDPLHQLLCHGFLMPPHSSTIWSSLCKVLAHVADRLIWNFHDGSRIPIASNRLRGLSGYRGLSVALNHWLSHRGLFYLSQVIHGWTYDVPIFKSAMQMGLDGALAEEWNQFMIDLSGAGLVYATGGDLIVWDGPIQDNSVIVKDVYRSINSSTYLEQYTTVFAPFWKYNMPTKITLFGWLIWKGRVLTWENLVKRGQHGPSRCCYCNMAEETCVHLFFSCPVVSRIWRLFSLHFMGSNWTPSNFLNVAYDWSKLKGRFKPLPFFFIWEIWLARIGMIFENRNVDIPHIYANILKWIEDRPQQVDMMVDGSRRIRPHEIKIPTVFFYGACRDEIIGCGVWVKLSNKARINIHWNGGHGSNNKAEFMALWGGLWIVLNMKIPQINIYGDSKFVVECMKDSYSLNVPGLIGWYKRAKLLWNLLNRPPIKHIYRENNTRADGLSKKGLTAEAGCGRWTKDVAEVFYRRAWNNYIILINASIFRLYPHLSLYFCFLCADLFQFCDWYSMRMSPRLYRDVSNQKFLSPN